MAGRRRLLTHDLLRDHLKTGSFRHGIRDRVGAEVELIPWAVAGDRVDVRAALDASDRLWSEWPDGEGARGEGSIPWRGGSLTREPGGQWEFSGPPLNSPEDTACEMSSSVEIIKERAISAGFDVLAIGLNPWADVETIGLRNPSARYAAMQEYFDSIGPSGRRMMRLTSSVQVAVDFLPEDIHHERWELGQRLAPILTAAFANSAVENRQPAPSPCQRAQTWLQLDPKRTGIPQRFLDDPESDPVDQYLDFALNAPVMFVARKDGSLDVPSEPTPFSLWMEHGLPAGYPELIDWETHLSTLFPDVRPRGYLEVRAMDAPGTAWLAVPILIVGHALRDPQTRRELLEQLRPFHESLSELRFQAANRALADPTLRELAGLMFATVRRNLRGPAEELVAAYDQRYIQRGLTPGEELRSRIPAGDELEPGHLIALEADRRAVADPALAPLALFC